MTFIDIHSHLDICKNQEQIMQNAKSKNVGIILTCGTNKNSNRKALELADRYKNYGVKACLGIYPTDALKIVEDEWDDESAFIRLNANRFIAIGEIGLDLKELDNRSLIKQKHMLKIFIDLAKSLNKPIIVHSRKAEAETIDFLEQQGCKKVIMHCFMGDFMLVRRIIKNGWYLSIPCILKNSEHFQKVVEIAPLNQIFCETDAPFLHPDRLPNNESANVAESYKKIAEIKHLPLNAVEKAIEDNYRRLFNTF